MVPMEADSADLAAAIHQAYAFAILSCFQCGVVTRGSTADDE
jgi:hypothetical protein